MATSFWYYRTLGEEFGPVSEAALLDMVQSGQLGSDEEVRPATRMEWKTVEEFMSSRIEQPSSDDLELMLSAAEPARAEALSIDSFEIGSEDSRPQRRGAVRAPKWYCRIGGQQRGPFDLPALTRLVDAGELAPTDRVRLEDDTMWVTADGIDGLFDGVVLPPLGPGGANRSAVRPQSESSRGQDSAEGFETVVDQSDTDVGFELSEPDTEARQPTGSKSARGSKKKVAKKAPAKRKPTISTDDIADISTDDIADILSEPMDDGDESSDEDDAVSGRSSSRAVAAPSRAERPAVALSAPPVAPAYTPPAAAPRPAPPKSFTPPRRSSSSGPSWVQELLQEPKKLAIVGVLLLAPLLYFAWPVLGSALVGKRVITGNRHYYLMAEQVYVAFKQGGPTGAKSAAEAMQKKLKDVADGTQAKASPAAEKLHQLATEQFPKLAESDAKTFPSNLQQIKRTLDSIKTQL